MQKHPLQAWDAQAEREGLWEHGFIGPESSTNIPSYNSVDNPREKGRGPAPRLQFGRSLQQTSRGNRHRKTMPLCIVGRSVQGISQDPKVRLSLAWCP